MKNIFITGFMGCGKTEIGKLINIQTNFKVIDTDKTIEQATHLKINQIFHKYGENYFRTLEYELLKKINKKQNLIIVTGGASLISQINFNVIKNNSIIFLLNSNFNVCYKRIKNSNRPLVAKLNSYKQLKKLYLHRKKKYEQIAHYSIAEFFNLPINFKLKKVLKLIKKIKQNNLF